MIGGTLFFYMVSVYFSRTDCSLGFVNPILEYIYWGHDAAMAQVVNVNTVCKHLKRTEYTEEDNQYNKWWYLMSKLAGGDWK